MLILDHNTVHLGLIGFDNFGRRSNGAQLVLQLVVFIIEASFWYARTYV